MKTIATLEPVAKSTTIRIPERVLEAINLYATEGQPTGGFVKSVLCNDLFGAIGRADSMSLAAIDAICCYVFNALPADCHGSPEAYKAHLLKAQD